MITANLITEKATELFTLYNIRSIAVRDIADDLGVSKKTVDAFFVDKAALVEAVIDGMLGKNQTGCHLIKTQSDHAIAEIYLLVNYLADFYSHLDLLMIEDLKFAYPNAVEKLKNYKNGFLQELVKANINTGIQENLYREDLDANIATSFILQNLLFVGTLSQEGDDFSAKSEVVSQIVFGLVNAKGALRIQQFRQIHELIKHKKNDYSPLWDH